MSKGTAISPLGPGLALVLMLGLIAMTLFGYLIGFGYIIYAVGWMIAGHGFNLGINWIKINATHFFAILLSLLIFYAVWKVLTYMHMPTGMWGLLLPIIIYSIIFLFVFLGWNLFGLLLMFYAQNYLGTNPWVFDQIELVWDEWKYLLEPAMLVMFFIMASFMAVKITTVVRRAQREALYGVRP